jgi:hypothetical protein
VVFTKLLAIILRPFSRKGALTVESSAEKAMITFVIMHP